jgi:hypothetical protein
MKPSKSALYALVAVTVALGTAVPAFSDELQVSESGTWGTTCPATFCAGPGDTWSWSFDIASNPTPHDFVSGVQTDVPITNFIFETNGNVVSVPNPTLADFGFPPATGGFSMAINNNEVLLSGSQLYTGTEAAPNFAPGVFSVNLSGTEIGGVSPATASPITISAVPEPASWLFMMTVAGVLVWKRNRVHLVGRRQVGRV